MDHPPASGPAFEIIGREAESLRLDEFCAALTRGAHALVLDGEAGIGKTALLRHGVDLCRMRSYEVLTARGTEEEMSGPLVGLVDLFEATDADDAVVCPETDPFERGRAVLGTLRRLAKDAPVVLAIDDAQWLDPVSARALRYAFRRLDAECVGVLATQRLDGGTEDRVALARSLPPGRTETISMGPLSPLETRELLRGFVSTISPLAFRKIYQVSGGNPLYAIELSRSLRGEERAIGIAESFPLPDSLQGVIERRLATIAPDVLALLRIASAVGPTSFEEMAVYYPDPELRSVLAEATALDLLVLEDDLRIRFEHPLVGSAVYGGMNPLDRRALHRTLSEQAPDPDAQARHIALSTDGPDENTAALIETAAVRASQRGASDLAAEFAHHSRRLTPSTDLVSAQRRALLEITNVAVAGEASRALDLVDDLVASLPPSPMRAEALVQRFYVENDNVDLGDATLVQALEDAEGDAPLRGRVLDILGWFRGVFRGDLRRGLQCAAEALEIALETDDDRLRMVAGAHLAHMQAMSGQPDPAAMERSISIADQIGDPTLGGGPRAWLAKQAFWAGDLEDAANSFEELLGPDSGIGNQLERPYRHYDCALVACAAGDFALARDHVQAGSVASQDSENEDAEGWLLYPRALIEAWVGDPKARETATRLLAWPGRPGGRLGSARARTATALLAMSEGDAAAAADELIVAAELAEAMGLGHPGALSAKPDAIIALSAAGRIEEAGGLLEGLAEQVGELGLERPRAMFEHAKGGLLLARGDADEAAAVLTSAVARFDRLGLRPDAARASLCHGQALLRAGQRTAAATSLGEAYTRFDTLGASLWRLRAAADLERANPGRVGGVLTTTEANIADLVAEGAKNREIAAALFVSVATVEAHLTRMYRKLEVRSRTELARLVHDGVVATAGADAP